VIDQGPGHDDEVQSALHTVLENFGPQALSREAVLSNILSDLLPDNQREASLLKLAAQADVAGALTQATSEGMDPDTAVRFASRRLADSSPATPEACTWVTGEIARALGYQVTPAAFSPETNLVNRATVPAPPSPPPPPPAPPGPQGERAAPTVYGPPPAPPAGPVPGPAPGPGPLAPQYRQGPPPPPPPPVKKKRSAVKVVVPIIVVVLLVLVVLVVLAATKSGPFGPSPTPTTRPPTPTPTAPGPSLSLARLMPFTTTQESDGVDLSTCQDNVGDAPNDLKHLSAYSSCGTLPGFAGWSLTGYQFDNAADYQAGLALLNNPQHLDFNPQAADQGCPPPSETAKGIDNWHSTAYPQQPAGQQVIECLQTDDGNGNALDTYFWTLPSQDAIFEIQAATGVPFSQVDSWWQAHGAPGS
jgi:hypothetical protein